MRVSIRKFAKTTLSILAVGVMPLAFNSHASTFDWAPVRDESVVEIITVDRDDSKRETKIWIVVLDDVGFIRTNDSRWLANIRRDPAVRLRTREIELAVTATIVDDAVVFDRVEQAFKDKYGLMQRFMSAIRFQRPTLMRITPRAAAP